MNSGSKLETFLISYFQAKDYFVEGNLKWNVDKQEKGSYDFFEIDVLASKFQTNDIFTILSECKRGCTNNDLVKFIGVVAYVKANENWLVCESKSFDEIFQMGKEQNIIVIDPKTLLTQTNQRFVDKLKLFYQSNIYCQHIIDKNTLISLSPNHKFSELESEAYASIRRYLVLMSGKIWRENDNIKRVKLVKKLIEDNKDFARQIYRTATACKAPKKTEIYMQENFLSCAAGFLMMKAKISYIICAIRLAIDMNNGLTKELLELKDESLYEVVTFFSRNIDKAIKIPNFIQSLIFIFGGMYTEQGDDIAMVSAYLNINKLTFMDMIIFVKELFKIRECNIQWGFTSDMGVTTFKYVPNSLKGLGLMNRNILNINTECFYGKNIYIDDYKRICKNINKQ